MNRLYYLVSVDVCPKQDAEDYIKWLNENMIANYSVPCTETTHLYIIASGLYQMDMLREWDEEYDDFNIFHVKTLSAQVIGDKLYE